MKKTSFIKQISFIPLLAVMTSSMALAATPSRTVNSVSPLPDSVDVGVVNLGPCKVYEGDGGDEATNGSAVLINCNISSYPLANNTVGLIIDQLNYLNAAAINFCGTPCPGWGPTIRSPLSASPPIMPNFWVAGGVDTVFATSTGYTLREYAAGQPPGFTPYIGTGSATNTFSPYPLDMRVVIVSYRDYLCPYAMPGVYQAKTVPLSGGVGNVGGYVCGSVIIKPPATSLPVIPITPSAPSRGGGSSTLLKKMVE